jgi:hypothetical protein
MSGDVARVRHDLSGVSLAREGEASDTGGYSDAHIRVSVANRGGLDDNRHCDSDSAARVPDVGRDGEGQVPGVREYSEAEELAVIERLSQQRDMLEEAVWKKKEENAGLKDGLRQRKQSLQDRRYELQAEVRGLCLDLGFRGGSVRNMRHYGWGRAYTSLPMMGSFASQAQGCLSSCCRLTFYTLGGRTLSQRQL